MPEPASFWTKLRSIDLNPETAFRRKRRPPASRRVMVNTDLPREMYDSKGKVSKNAVYDSNQIVSAKYTIYNFVFKNLLEQFRRVANIFFLVLVILQFFPQFTTISPGVAMLPLLIVLFITMVKDGYEDVKRHQSDHIVNRQKCRVLVDHGFKNSNHMAPKNKSVRVVWQVIQGYLIPPFLLRRMSGQRKAPDMQQLETHGLHQVTSRPMRAMSPPPMATIQENDTGAVPTMPVSSPTTYQSRTFEDALPRSSTETTRSDAPHHKDSMETEASFHHGTGNLRWKVRHWEDVRVGDVVYLRNNDPVPADMVICSTSEDDGSCFVETKNLDGEINLKSRFAVPELRDMVSADTCADRHFDIEVEPQHTDMYRFNARANLLDREDEEGNMVSCPVTLNQVLLRGCSVRNTDWVIGVVLMTGADSKIVLNSGDTPSKLSRMEHLMNRMVYINLALIGVIAVVCAVADAQLEKHYFARQAYWEYLSIFNDDNPSLNGLVSFANSLITFQNFVPISLHISFEVVRTIQALFIFEDADMYYEKTSRRTTAKSWNLSDELGQVQYIVSDKTGTLTQNVMIFRGCAINGTVYHGHGQKPDFPTGRKRITVKPALADVPSFHDDQLMSDLRSSSPQQERVREFLCCLSLCHTAQVAPTEEKSVISYRAESPDEQALVQMAADNGFVYCRRHINTVELQVPEDKPRELYELLHVLEFSSARKRMAVVLKRHSDNKLIMYAKGADSMIYSRLRGDQSDEMRITDKALEEFANHGLRTLCLARKELDPTTYVAWARRYQQASMATENREEMMEELASELEQDYELVGATAIEDRLQEGVPETIADLKRAGINIWVATGDKLETAIAIGYSTKLLSTDMNLVIVRGGEYGTRHSAYEQLETAMERFFGGVDTSEMKNPPPPVDVDVTESAARSVVSQVSLVGADNGARPGGYALIIDGHALNFVMEEPHSNELLRSVAKRCRAVVCCRVSPLQKAHIVRLVRKGLEGTTLAIGDGANDVSMIQAAHVGVGVAGEEGLQAVNSSDYAIGQFRFLKRLILVHGHWSFYRNSKLVNVFFYKQMVHTGTLFWFQIYCAWSTTQAIDYVYLLLYNAIWTVAAVIAIGIFERNLSDHVLMQVPELYNASRLGRYFSLRKFLIYMLDGVYQSVVLYFFIMYFYDTTTPRHDGYDINLYEPTTGMVLATVLAANLYAGVESFSWTWWTVGVVVIPTLILFVFEPIYAAFQPTLIWTYSWGNNYALYRSAQFWLEGIITVFLCLLPRILYEYFRVHFFPTDVDIMRYIDSREPHHDYVHDPRMPGLRAAHSYDPAVDADASTRSQAPDSYPLMPTQSRSSSVYYDMSTGEQTYYRGYSFSAADQPTEKPKGMMRKLRRILQPRHRNRRGERDVDMPYVRSSQLMNENMSPSTEATSAPRKRESHISESMMQESVDGDNTAAPPIFVAETPVRSPRNAGPDATMNDLSDPNITVSDVFFTALDRGHDSHLH